MWRHTCICRVYVLLGQAQTLIKVFSSVVLTPDAVSHPHVAAFPFFLLQINAWAPVSLLWLTAAVPLSRAVSTPRCSAAARRDAAGLWGRSLRCALSGALVSVTT